MKKYLLYDLTSVEKLSQAFRKYYQKINGQYYIIKNSFLCKRLKRKRREL